MYPGADARAEPDNWDMDADLASGMTTLHLQRSTRPSRLRWAAAATGAVLLLGGCGAADVAKQQVEQAVDSIASSARAQAEALLDEARSALPDAQLQVSDENRAAFEDLRTDLEQVNERVVELLAAPQDLSEAALAPLQEQLAALQSSIQQRTAELTGISASEQQAWAALAQSVQATAEQVGALVGLLG
jgi:chromosome segregation ATPase